MTFKLILISSTLMLGILASAQTIFACTCEIPSASSSLRKKVRDARKKSFAVFAGEVLKISEQTDGYGVKVTLRIDSMWKGPETSEALVSTGKDGGDCGYPFVVGKKYLVYASQSKDGFLTTNICQRTQLLSLAKEDIAVLGKPIIYQNSKTKQY